MTGLRTVGGGLIGPIAVTKNLFPNPLARAVGGAYEIRRNYTTDPAATKNSGTQPANTFTWQALWYGSGTGAGTTTILTGIVGPVPEITTAIRKTWTASPSGNGDTGFGHNQRGLSGYAVTPGQVWTISSYMRASTVTPKTAYNRAFFYDAAGAIIGTAQGGATVNLTTSWQRITATYTVPANAVSMTLWSDAGTTGNGIWQPGDTLDATGLLIEKSNRMGTYFDGRTPAFRGLSFVWAGSPDNSNPVGQGKPPSNFFSGHCFRYQADGGGGVVIRPDEISVDSFVSLGGDTGALQLGMQPGKTYTVSAEGVATAADPNEDSGRALRIAFYVKSGGVYTSTISGKVPAGPNIVPLRVSVTRTIPADATEAFIRIYNGSLVRDSTWNRISVIEGTDASAIDGDQPQDDTTAYLWTGAVDASTSERVTRLPFNAFKPDGSSFVQMQKVRKRINAFPNPDSNGVSGQAELRRNFCTNPQPATAASWAGPNGTVVTAPWDSSRKAYQTVADGTNTQYTFSAPGGSFVTGDVVTVSAMVQAPAGVWLRPTVHVRTGNKYYTTNASPVLSTGAPVRLSHTATISANDPDVDMAVLTWNTNTGGSVPAGTATIMGDVLIEKATVSRPYFDGSTPPAGDFTYAWVGTANASASRVLAPNPIGTGMVRGVAYQAAGGADGTGYCIRGLVTDGSSFTTLAQRFSYGAMCAPGQVWSFGAKMRYSQPGGFCLAVQFTDINYNVVSSPQSPPVINVPANTWAYIKMENVVVPAGANRAQFWFGLQNGGAMYELMDMDEIVIEQGTTVGPFFSGRKPADNDYTYTWLGTVDNSSSVANP